MDSSLSCKPTHGIKQKLLGMKINEETVLGRTDLLRKRLVSDQKKRILIILDDLWKGLDLTAAGISFQGNKEGISHTKIHHPDDDRCTISMNYRLLHTLYIHHRPCTFSLPSCLCFNHHKPPKKVEKKNQYLLSISTRGGRRNCVK